MRTEEKNNGERRNGSILVQLLQELSHNIRDSLNICVHGPENVFIPSVKSRASQWKTCKYPMESCVRWLHPKGVLLFQWKREGGGQKWIEESSMFGQRGMKKRNKELWGKSYNWPAQLNHDLFSVPVVGLWSVSWEKKGEKERKERRKGFALPPFFPIHHKSRFFSSLQFSLFLANSFFLSFFLLQFFQDFLHVNIVKFPFVTLKWLITFSSWSSQQQNFQWTRSEKKNGKKGTTSTGRPEKEKLIIDLISFPILFFLFELEFTKSHLHRWQITRCLYYSITVLGKNCKVVYKTSEKRTIKTCLLLNIKHKIHCHKLMRVALLFKL